MTGLNHYLVGVGTAVILENPLLVAPVAFASHFVLDSLPHFGLKFDEGRGKTLIGVAMVDVALLIPVVVLTIARYPTWYVAAGLIAMSPDIAWVYRFCISEKFGNLPPKPANKFNSWHISIQKLESKWGMVVEICFAVAIFLTVFKK